MSEFDDDLMRCLQERGSPIFPRPNFTPQDMYQRIVETRPTLESLRDIYELNGAKCEPYLSPQQSMTFISENIPASIFSEMKNEAYYLGDQLTDIVYKIPISNEIISEIENIPQNNVIISSNGKVLIVFTFEGDILLHRT